MDYKDNKYTRGEMKEIITDFDGTICGYAFPDCGEPTEGVREALTIIKNRGFKIIIHSCRTSHYWTHVFPDQNPHHQLNIITAYLKKHDIPYDGICFLDKPVADYMIDDRAIGFRGDWMDVLKELDYLEEKRTNLSKKDKTCQEAVNENADKITL